MQSRVARAWDAACYRCNWTFGMFLLRYWRWYYGRNGMLAAFLEADRAERERREVPGLTLISVPAPLPRTGVSEKLARSVSALALCAISFCAAWVILTLIFAEDPDGYTQRARDWSVHGTAARK